MIEKKYHCVRNTLCFSLELPVKAVSASELSNVSTKRFAIEFELAVRIPGIGLEVMA